jgi:hypothetical protein
MKGVIIMYNSYYTCSPSNYSYPTESQVSSYPSYSTQNGDRFIGAGFAAPFLLGGLAGAALAPSFYPRPYYGFGGYPGYGYPMAPCCQPRFW